MAGFAFFTFSFFLARKKGKKVEFRDFLTSKNRPRVGEQAHRFFSFYFTEKQKIIGSPRRGSCAVFLPVLILLEALFVATTH